MAHSTTNQRPTYSGPEESPSRYQKHHVELLDIRVGWDSLQGEPVPFFGCAGALLDLAGPRRSGVEKKIGCLAQ